MRTNAVTLNIESAAREFAVDAETLRRGFLALGIETKKGARYPLATIWKALSGDYKAAKAREAQANAIAKERENRIADRELIPYDDAESVFVDSHTPLVNAIDALPDYGARVNPGDPELGTAALREIADNMKASVRADFSQMLKALETARDARKK